MLSIKSNIINMTLDSQNNSILIHKIISQSETGTILLERRSQYQGVRQ